MTDRRSADLALTTEEPVHTDHHCSSASRLTEFEKEAIREELHRLLASTRFHSSHRCQTLLRYVVEESLRGNADSLKERNVGIAVFERDVAYDTNDDPVVRMAAGELRKKLAQYYYDPANQSKIHIELPTGSYAPVFRTADAHLHAEEKGTPNHPDKAEPEISAATQGQAARNARWTRPTTWWLAAVLALAAVSVISFILLRQSQPKAQDAFDLFWAPVINSPNPVLLCMGQMRATRVQLDPNAARNPFSTPMTLNPKSDYPKELPIAVLSDAITLANVAGLLRAAKKTFAMRGEAATTFGDLQKGPVVLLGAYNNDWTMRLMEPMRFHFGMDPGNYKWWIEDRQRPELQIGAAQVGKISSLVEDYALVARTFDSQTKQPIIFIAGLSPFATQAAGEFLTNPQYLDEFSKKAPHDWQTKNMELLIHTNIVDNEAGPPQVVASYFW